MYDNNIIEFPKITFYVVSQYIHRRTLICPIIVYIIRIFSFPKNPAVACIFVRNYIIKKVVVSKCIHEKRLSFKNYYLILTESNLVEYDRYKETFETNIISLFP